MPLRTGWEVRYTLQDDLIHICLVNWAAPKLPRHLECQSKLDEQALWIPFIPKPPHHLTPHLISKEPVQGLLNFFFIAATLMFLYFSGSYLPHRQSVV